MEATSGVAAALPSEIADLRVSISAARAPAAAGGRMAASLAAGRDLEPGGLAATVGDTLIFTIVVTNGGPADATNVQLTDAVSASTPVSSVVATQGSCTLTSSTAVACALATVAAGGQATVTVTAKATTSGIATSTATVVADQPSADPAGLEATTTVQVTPRPVYKRTFNLAPVSGTVTYRLPKGGSFVPLVMLTNVPKGTEVNATNGIAAVVGARNPANTPQIGKFTGGRFVISYQPRVVDKKKAKKELLVTQLRLSAPLSCRKRQTAAADPSRHSRSLWGNVKGNFRTSARFGAATVRGTEWFTKDTCATTTVRVRHGRVDVYDFLRKKHIFVTTGHSYTARKRAR